MNGKIILRETTEGYILIREYQRPHCIMRKNLKTPTQIYVELVTHCQEFARITECEFVDETRQKESQLAQTASIKPNIVQATLVHKSKSSRSDGPHRLPCDNSS